jgi:hypothetical protein
VHLKNFESTNKKRNRNGGSALSSRSVQICSCRSTDGEKEYISNETAAILQLWNILRKILQTKINIKRLVKIKRNTKDQTALKYNKKDSYLKRNEKKLQKSNKFETPRER